MTSLGKQCLVAAFAGAVALGANVGAWAGKHDAVRVESGGASLEQFDALLQRAPEYSLKLIVAAKGSGAWLADVDVAVVALPEREVVLQHRTQGPLMLAALPPGRYEVSGTFADVLPGAASTVKRTVLVPRNGMAETVLYFETGD